MSNKSTATVATMGIDIGKNSFHVVGFDEHGAIVLRQKWSRAQVEARFAANAAVPDRHGGLCRRASPEPQAASAWSRCPVTCRYLRAWKFLNVALRRNSGGSRALTSFAHQGYRRPRRRTAAS